MNAMFTALNDSITNLLDTINSTTDALFAQANERKENYRAAYLALEQSAKDISEFSEILGRLDDVAPISLKCDEVADFIFESLDDTYIFESPVEEFDGYCDMCGKEIMRADPVYLISDDGEEMLVCTQCHDAFIEAQDAEAVEVENDNAPLNPMDSPCAHD